MIHKLLLLIPIFVFTYIHSHAQDKAKGLTTSDSLLTYMGRLMLSGKNLLAFRQYRIFLRGKDMVQGIRDKSL